MLKTVLAASTALALTGATLAYAQQGAGPRPDAPRWRPSAEDMSALGDARIAALKAGLRLTTEQEKNWPALETALKAAAKQRSERFAARASADRAQRQDPIERLSQRAERMTQDGATLKAVADAAGPLYKSLDDGQKKRFTMLARFSMSGRDGGMGWHHRRGEHHRNGPRHGGPDQGSAPPRP